MKHIALILMLGVLPVSIGTASTVEDPFCLPIKYTNEIEYSDYELFSFALGWRESNNDYRVINRWGYLGKYQFSPVTLRVLGYQGTKQQFLNSPELQELYFKKLLISNKKVLKNYIKMFEGQEIDGIVVTESGILAAAHLVGVGNVKKYFNTGYIKRDGLGTPVTEYLYLFQNYDLQL